MTHTIHHGDCLDVLRSSITTGMNVNGWTFDQAYEAAVAAMIATDRDAMTELAKAVA